MTGVSGRPTDRTVTTMVSFYVICTKNTNVLGSKSFRPDIQKPHQIENAAREML
jgi:hypothetical protein